MKDIRGCGGPDDALPLVTNVRVPDGMERSVNAEEFLRLALSNRKLWRHDDALQGRRGLLDPHTGERILTRDSWLAQLASHGDS